MCRHRRLQDRQRLQTSTLATHSYNHPDVPTPQSVRWRLQLPACQLGLQHNIPGRREPRLLGNIQQPWTVVLTNGKSQFSSHRWNFSTNLDWPAQVSDRTADCQTDVFQESSCNHNTVPVITPPRLKVPTHSDLVKRWSFRKADWKRFCLLTGESVERLPPLDALNIERAYQNLWEPNICG